VRETSSEPGSYERTLRRLLGEALGGDSHDDWHRSFTMCAPGWLLERISAETGEPIETYKAVRSVTTDALVVTGVPALEHEGGLGFLAAVNVITGRCVELTACHADVPPNRWPDLTLALAYGLGSPLSVAIEMIGADDAG
jgi:hypothetical protein